MTYMHYEILENSDFDELYLEYAKFRLDHKVVKHEYRYCSVTKLHIVKTYYVD